LARMGRFTSGHSIVINSTPSTPTVRNAGPLRQGGGISSSPALGADGTVYVGSLDNKLYAVNPDGTQRWAFTAGGGISSSPALGADGTVYVGSLDKKLYAVNPDGTQRWNFTTGDKISSSPALGADGTVYVGSNDGKLYAVNPDGTQRWAFTIGYIIESSPALGADGTVYVGSSDHKLYAINPDGTQRWNFTTGDKIWSSPTLDAGGTVYVGSYDKKLYAINPDGTQRWAFTTGGEVWDSPVIGVDGTVYIGSMDGKLYAIGSGTQTLSITPPTTTINTGATQQFTANPAAGVTWTTTGGTISNTGLFTAGNTAGTYTVTAKNTTDTATASVTITAPKPTIIITTPNGGEKWQQGVPENIFWTSANVTGNLNIDLYKAGVFLRTISANIPNTGNGATITLAAAIAPAGTDYRLKISSIADPAINSMSAADFEITGAAPAATITITSPNGGEQWQQGSAHPITWTSTGVPGNVKIDLFKGNVLNSTIIASTTNTGSFNWTVPANQAAGTDYQVKIIDLADVTVQSKSATNFAIVPAIQNATLTVTSPNGGEKWQQMTRYPVTWTSTGNPGNLKIDILKSGKMVNTIAANIPDTGSYNWDINFTTVPGIDYRIQISTWPGGVLTAQSAADFEVTTKTASPAITITAPNGGEQWQQGSAHPITWTSTGVPGNVKIDLFKGGVLNSTIIASASNTGSFNWTVPANQAVGTDYQVKIIDLADVTVQSKSAANFAIIAGAPKSNDPWPMFRHDLQHTGRSPYIGPTYPIEKWTYLVKDLILSSPTIGTDGTIYFSSMNNKIYALNQTGTLKWTFTTGDHVQSSPLLGPDGTIYVGSLDKNVYAINSDGTQKWKFATTNEVLSSPIIDIDGTIYVGSKDGKVYAIKPDGSQKWSFSTGREVDSSPAIGTDGTIYVGSLDTKLYAINPDGTQKWAFTTGGSIMFSSPAIGTDGTIYIGNSDKKVYAVNPDGTKKWTFTTGDVVESSPAIGVDGTIYVGSNDNKLYALNPNGTQKWAFTAGNRVESSPAIDANGVIYFGAEDNKVYAVNPNGTKKWSINLTSSVTTSSPAISADGTIYIGEYGSGNDLFYAIGNGTAPTLTIAPPTATLNTGATQQFTATPAAGITWTATGGTISNTGLFTAGNTAGTFVVTAKSAAGTATASVTITAKPTLATPVLLSPANRAIKIAMPTTIAWQPVNNAVSYEYELYSAASATVPIESQIVTATSATIQYNLAAATLYTWRVRAIDANDLQSAFSIKWAFTTQAQAAIGTPVLTYPLNNAIDIITNPTLTWQSTANSTVYAVDIATDAAFTAPIVSVQNVTATSYSVAALNNSTKYYWRVKGGNGIIWGSPAAASFTTIAKQGLAFPVLTSPTNGSTGAAIATTLTWLPVDNAVNYTVQYATNNNFNKATVLTGAATTQNVTLLASTRYYWHVKAIDANGQESGWSSAWYFTTAAQTAQMDAPTLITPADSAIDVPIKTTFAWTAVANAVAYDIEVSKDTTFATRAVMGSNITSLTTTLANSIVYYWRVRGKNGNSLGTWSAVGTFTTAAFVPTTGVDAAIANSKVGSPLMGIGVVNNDGTLQTVTVEQPINRQSEFNIVVKNTGNQPDNFLISTTSTINAKWKVTVFDVSGIDITRKVFNGGWSSYIVKPGESVIMRLRFAATSGQVIDPANPPTQSITLTAQSWKDITNGIATPASDTVVGKAVLVKMSK